VLDDPCLHHLLHPPRVAIIGAPNVGKSTLANRLFGQQRSITADLPGTTRDWVGEIANIDGLAVVLVDTPGVRRTDDPIEAAAIGRADQVARQADLIVLVLDVMAPWPPEQHELYERYQRGSPAVIHVVNKIDRPSGWGGNADAWTIATTGQGVDELRAAIRRFFGCADLAPGRARCWTARQREQLRGMLKG
jgi:tRNA modification GTPase